MPQMSFRFRLSMLFGFLVFANLALLGGYCPPPNAPLATIMRQAEELHGHVYSSDSRTERDGN